MDGAWVAIQPPIQGDMLQKSDLAKKLQQGLVHETCLRSQFGRRRFFGNMPLTAFRQKDLFEESIGLERKSGALQYLHKSTQNNVLKVS